MSRTSGRISLTFYIRVSTENCSAESKEFSSKQNSSILYRMPWVYKRNSLVFDSRKYVETLRRLSIESRGVPFFYRTVYSMLGFLFWNRRVSFLVTPVFLSVSFENISHNFLRRIAVEICSRISSISYGRFSVIFYSRIPVVLFSRVCSFLGGRIAFNILAVLGWTYFVFAMALHRAPQVPPRVGRFRRHWHGADVKRGEF